MTQNDFYVVGGVCMRTQSVDASARDFGTTRPVPLREWAGRFAPCEWIPNAVLSQH